MIEFLEASSDDAVLAALATEIGGEAPTGDNLAGWFGAGECPDAALDEANARLRALEATAVTEDEPSAWVGFGSAQAGMLIAEHDVHLQLTMILPVQPSRPVRPGMLVAEHNVAREVVGMFGFVSLARWWSMSRELDGCPKFPLTPIVEAWQRRPLPPQLTHVLVTQERKPPDDAESLTLARMPGVLALTLTDLEAVPVEGEPLATATPDGELLRRYRVRGAAQGELFPAPRKLDGHATAGAMIEAVARLPLTGDERSPLRADLLRAGAFAYALTGPIEMTTPQASVLLTGRDTPTGRKQALDLLWMARALSINGRDGELWAAFDSEPGTVHRFGPPRWWLDNEGNRAHRLTGALFRRIPGEGRKATRWGSLERTIAGIEGALLWGPTARKGRGGRFPDAVRPVRRGGAGAPVFIPWWQVLRLSGEHVHPVALDDATFNATLRKRYGRRIDALEAAGYFLPMNMETGQPILNAAARAGDTVEIVRRTAGGRHHGAGIEVRATARFCAAYAKGGERIRLPAIHLLTER